ncbi:uncharacterized protein Obp49a [Epargyreus clarus]|uniref:uncharacterized protein Obp49a n=1 Tax=Epargyreus clarus TaxID=520877 RepID=UPI003C2DFCDF
MFLCIIFALAVSACIAEEAVSSPIRCAAIPYTIYSCIGNPRIIKRGASINCDTSANECEKMTCIFRNSGWLKDGKVEKEKVVAHFDQFATDNPEWSAALQHAKTTCLASNLPAQGAQLNCPAYDIMICALSSFIKNAQPSQWSNAEQCEYPKQYAAACPVCPNDCFAPLVPYGSCNACLALPRSP